MAKKTSKKKTSRTTTFFSGAAAPTVTFAEAMQEAESRAAAKTRREAAKARRELEAIVAATPRGERVRLPAPSTPYVPPQTEESIVKRIGRAQEARSHRVLDAVAERATHAFFTGSELQSVQRAVDEAVEVLGERSAADMKKAMLQKIRGPEKVTTYFSGAATPIETLLAQDAQRRSALAAEKLEREAREEARGPEGAMYVPVESRTPEGAAPPIGAVRSVRLGRHEEARFGPKVQAAAEHAHARALATAREALASPEAAEEQRAQMVASARESRTDREWQKLQEFAWRAERVRGGGLTPAQASREQPTAEQLRGLSQKQLAYAVARLGPEMPATAADFTTAIQQRMEVIPYVDEDGNKKFLRLPILDEEPDEHGVRGVRADTEAIATRYAGETSQKGSLQRIGMKVRAPEITFQRMERAQEHAAGEVVALSDMRRLFNALVRDYNKYSDKQRKTKLSDAQGTRNAPMDRNRIIWMMKDFGFQLPEWSKVKLPRTWR